MERRVEREELRGREVGRVHGLEQDFGGRQVGWGAASARSPATDVSRMSRVRTMSATGKPRAATCSRMSALMPPPGVEMMIAPALGPEPSGCG